MCPFLSQIKLEEAINGFQLRSLFVLQGQKRCGPEYFLLPGRKLDLTLQCLLSGGMPALGLQGSDHSSGTGGRGRHRGGTNHTPCEHWMRGSQMAANPFVADQLAWLSIAKRLNLVLLKLV